MCGAIAEWERREYTMRSGKGSKEELLMEMMFYKLKLVKEKRESWLEKGKVGCVCV